MALVSGGKSTLNPNAPLFIPAAYRRVEDFSPKWWQLITTSTWYQNYWISQHQEDEEEEDGFYGNTAEEDDGFDGEDVGVLLPDALDLDVDEYFSSLDAQFEEFVESYETEVENRSSSAVPTNGLQLHIDGFAIEAEAPRKDKDQ